MIKLFYITNAINGSGGLERVLAVKASYLADTLGYKVHILTLNNGDKSPFYNFSTNIKFIDIKVSGNAINYFLQYKKGIKNALKVVNPDVISVCDDGLKGLLFPIFFGKKTPVIYERHASLDFNFISEKNNSAIQKLKNYGVQSAMLWSAKKFDAFVVLTNGNKKDWHTVNCTAIPNPSPFKNSIKDFKAAKKNIILAVGSQSYNKGFDRLLTIWGLIEKKYPDWSIEVYGKQHKKLNLQQKLKEQGLSARFSFNEPIKNIADKYAEASIFVLPSRSEGFGMVLIEAMSFGVPCVAFDCPHGPADIISNNKDGYIVANGNLEEFAEKLATLIEHQEKRKQMSGAAIKNVRRYAPEKIMPLWDELFKKMIN
ncbi:glycosyltransferase family 4 protein [Lutibacter sp. A80]|uniref:glycosyltransferase family 4 protein n=1 Tax=Lutibacter sp. A80 TaxID=2918453 RepID=UPI001F05A248|nr:glycosyltransferase family 4 protein [Lutibacter sp. A80]UMB60342.1 glycosyltransferase family 4 protein [Lutibacter sp. A80]